MFFIWSFFVLVLLLFITLHQICCSFRMADLFPDCVGEVDVISDAENIKKLLKLPYSKGPVSLIAKT